MTAEQLLKLHRLEAKEYGKLPRAQQNEKRLEWALRLEQAKGGQVNAGVTRSLNRRLLGLYNSLDDLHAAQASLEELVEWAPTAKEFAFLAYEMAELQVKMLNQRHGCVSARSAADSIFTAIDLYRAIDLDALSAIDVIAKFWLCNTVVAHRELAPFVGERLGPVAIEGVATIRAHPELESPVRNAETIAGFAMRLAFQDAREDVLSWGNNIIQGSSSAGADHKAFYARLLFIIKARGDDAAYGVMATEYLAERGLHGYQSVRMLLEAATAMAVSGDLESAIAAASQLLESRSDWRDSIDEGTVHDIQKKALGILGASAVRLGDEELVKNVLHWMQTFYPQRSLSSLRRALDQVQLDSPLKQAQM